MPEPKKREPSPVTLELRAYAVVVRLRAKLSDLDCKQTERSVKYKKTRELLNAKLTDANAAYKKLAGFGDSQAMK